MNATDANRLLKSALELIEELDNIVRPNEFDEQWANELTTYTKQIHGKEFPRDEANQLLNTGCEYLTELEAWAEPQMEDELKEKLNSFFQDVQFSDELPIIDPNVSADLEAQDDQWGDLKI